MHTSLMAIILVSIAIPPSDTAPLTSENYRVSEIVRVLSPTSFESKLENYKPAKSVRFRVTLRRPETQDSKEYLETILKTAGRIELRNAIFKSYFRVEAEISAATGRLRPGMEGVGKVEVGDRRLIWIWTHRFVDWLRLWHERGVQRSERGNRCHDQVSL